MVTTRTRSREASKESVVTSTPSTRKAPRLNVHVRSPTTVKDLEPEYKDLGLPSRESYVRAEAEYIQSLSQRKRDKALLSQEMFDDIWDVLHDPGNPTIRSPQFRFWVRKMFTLSIARRELDGSLFAQDEDADVKPIILHENRPVAIKTQIYDILGYCHQVSNHGGRDRTVAKVRELYSWVPKELVAKYVKVCPTCVLKKTGNMELALSLRSPDAPPLTLRDRARSRPVRRQPPPRFKHIDGMLLDPTVAPNPGFIHPQMLPLIAEATLPPYDLPLLPPPSVLAPNDPCRWLADLATQPGPGTRSLDLPPVVRRTESETDTSPFRRPTTRLALPPLFKALSESMVDPSGATQRLPLNVPEAFRIPPMHRAVPFVNPTEQLTVIDPALFLEDCSMALASKAKGLGPTGPHVATPVELPRKVLIPMNVLGADVPASCGRSSASLSSCSTRSLSSGKVSSGLFSKLSASVFHASDVSMASTSSGKRSNRSFDAQDWESTYCLDEKSI